MLESLRKSRNSKLVLFAFGAIILVFIFWGVGPSGSKSDSAVAVVDGVPIEAKEFANLYKRELDYYKTNFKEQFSDEMAKKMNLKQKTLDILINRTLALKQAGAEGIKADEKEVQEAIRSVKAFQKDGVFDKDLYFSVLSSNRLKPAEFEKSMENDILTARVRDKIVKDVKVTDDEVTKDYMKANKKVSLTYLAIDGSKFADPSAVKDEEAKEYLKKNGSAFMAPARVKAFYAVARYDELAKKASPTDQEIKDYYDKNSGQFVRPEAVKARHILIRPDQNATDKVKANTEARAKAEDILKKIKSGANFAELAKKYSQDPGSARQGGELGWFQKGIMVKSFEEAAFSLKKGETSNIVGTEFGFHIIQAEDKNEGGAAPFKTVAADIRKAVLKEKAADAARQIMASLEPQFREAKGADDLKKAVSGKDVKAVSTELFAENDMRVELIRNEALKETLLTMKANDVSRPVETPQGVYLIKVLERKEPYVPDYPEVAARVKERIASERGAEAASKKAAGVLKAAQGGKEMGELAREEKLKVEETGYFSRMEGFIPKIGAFAGDKDKLFELTAAAPYYPEVMPYNDKFYVLKLKEAKDADDAGFERQKGEIRNRLMVEKQDMALSNWLKDLRAKAKIKIYEERIN